LTFVCRTFILYVGKMKKILLLALMVPFLLAADARFSPSKFNGYWCGPEVVNGVVTDHMICNAVLYYKGTIRVQSSEDQRERIIIPRKVDYKGKTITYKESGDNCLMQYVVLDSDVQKDAQYTVDSCGDGFPTTYLFVRDLKDTEINKLKR